MLVLDYVLYRKRCKYNFCISATYMHSSFFCHCINLRVSSACYFWELCFELSVSVTTWPYVEVVGSRHMHKVNVKNTVFPAHIMEACRGD